MESIYLKVTRDYTPNDKDKRVTGGKDSVIAVEKGDIIFDVRKDDDGWMCGKNLNTGITGRFPSDCVAKLSDAGEKDKSRSDSSPKSAEKKESNGAKPLNRARPTVDKATEPKRITDPTGSLRRPPNPRPFGLSSRYPRPYEREKKESSGDSGCVEDEDDYYLNDKPPDKKKPLNNIRSLQNESETKKPSIYESRFGNKTNSNSPVYNTRPSVSKLKSAFLDNDQRNTKASEMKGKEKPKDIIEMSKKSAVKEAPNDKKTKVALATEDEDNDGMYACAELDDQKPSDINKNKKSDLPKGSKDKKVNIKDNPLSGEKAVGPTHSYQVPQAPPDKPRGGGCSECDEPHIYAAPDHTEPPSTPEAASEKYDFDPTENEQKKPLVNQEDKEKPNEEPKRRSYNRMASYESISNVGPEKSSNKGRSTESIKGAVNAVKKTKARITSSDRYPRMRIIAGICLGILTGVFVFFLFVAILFLPVVLAIVSGIIIGLVFGMILGFLDRKRLLCIVLLIFPSLFATRGKVAIWILIVYFIVAGPVCNLVGNINILALSSGECYMASTGVIGNAGYNDSNSTEANPSYMRVRHPLFQKYIDITLQFQVLVNKTLSHVRFEDLDQSRNRSTPYELCIEFLYLLRNNCMAISKSQLAICEKAAQLNPQVMSGCQLLRPPDFCASLSDAEIEVTCHNADFQRCEKFVNDTKEILDDMPGDAALAAYDYGQQPVIYTPARKKCDNAKSVLAMLLPLLILLLLYEAYSYHKLYLSRNNFDNQYLTNHFKTIEDTRKSSGASDGLLPLKKGEHQRFIQPTSPQFTIAEKQNMLKYLAVYLIFLAFALIFILGDYYLYSVVSNAKEDNANQQKVQQENDRTNSTNNTEPVGAVFGGLTCAPLILPLELYYVIVLSVLLGLLLLMILLQPYVLRLRHYIASRMYRRRERKRIAYLYYRLLEERKAFYKAVIDNINIENEENYALDHLDAVRVLAWNFQTMETIFSFLGVSLRSCMVCGRGLNRKYIYCETDTCESIYCRTCFYDLGNKCLGCMRDSNPLSRSSSFIQGSSRKRKNEITKGQGV